jgi:hypothetical protein
MTSFDYEVLWPILVPPLMGTIYDKNSSLAYTLSHLSLLYTRVQDCISSPPTFSHTPTGTLVISCIALRPRYKLV